MSRNHQQGPFRFRKRFAGCINRFLNIHGPPSTCKVRYRTLAGHACGYDLPSVPNQPSIASRYLILSENHSINGRLARGQSFGSSGMYTFIRRRATTCLDSTSLPIDGYGASQSRPLTMTPFSTTENSSTPQVKSGFTTALARFCGPQRWAMMMMDRSSIA